MEFLGCSNVVTECIVCEVFFRLVACIKTMSRCPLLR